MCGGSSPAPQPIPELAPVTVAPDPDDKAIKNTKKKKYASARRRYGRLSTVNTGDVSDSSLG